MKSQKNKEHRTTKKKQRIMMRRIDAYDGFCLKPGRCGLEALKSFWRWFRILRSFPAKQRRRNCYVYQHFLEPVSGKTQVLLTNGFKNQNFSRETSIFRLTLPVPCTRRSIVKTRKQSSYMPTVIYISFVAHFSKLYSKGTFWDGKVHT